MSSSSSSSPTSTPTPSTLSDRSSSDDSVSTLESSTSSSIDSENISTKKPAEWSALPVDLRAMCIRKMDFKTRMRLRGVSRLDKRIVESPCCRLCIDSLTLYRHDKEIRVYADCGGRKRIRMHDQIEEEEFGAYTWKVKCMFISLLKYTNIRHLTLMRLKVDFAKLFDEMAEVGAVIPGLSFNDLSDGNFQLALENFGVGVQVFNFAWISSKGLARMMRDAFLIPRLLNAKQIQFNTHRKILANDFIDMWIKNDKEMGSKLIFQLALFTIDLSENLLKQRGLEEDEKAMFALFLEKFADRVVDGTKEKKAIRIKTDNPEKHILMRVIHDNEKDNYNNKIELVRMVYQVIPATLKKEEYEKTSGTIRFFGDW